MVESLSLKMEEKHSARRIIKIMTKYPITFETFKRQVNHAVERRLGCGIYDLPDTITFSDYWSDDCKNEDEFWNMVEAATDDLLNDNGFQ